MSVDRIVDIEYQTGNLKLDTVRTGVLGNRDKLTEMGYECSWNGDLDLSAPLNPLELHERGYSLAGDEVITSFQKGGLPFTVVVFTKSEIAKIHGDNHVYQSELDGVRKEFDRFREVTGINLSLRQTSEPYSAE